MKAAVRSRYGSAEVLSIKNIETPVPKASEVLVKVRATTVNRTDCHVLTGKPLFMRLITGLFRPSLSVTGSDFAGQIEAIGENVRKFKVGDNVVGFIDMGARSHAQYLTIDEAKVTRAPASVTHEQAAACLEGAFYAMSGIQVIKPKAGQKALVIGATGAIGSSYVQFLKYYGAEVTAVCGGENSDLVRSLGADRIIDYKTEDYTKDSNHYDLVIDGIGKSSFSKCKHLLNEKGIYSSSQPGLFSTLLTSMSGGKREVFPVPRKLMENLEFICDLVEKGKYKPVIDRTYPLDKIAEAYTFVATGQKIGNVIIVMDM